MLDERRERWEQDLRNRQRNIVFPDTVLNEARGLRNVFSGNTKLTLLQRFCLILLGFSCCIPAAFLVRADVDIFRSIEGWSEISIWSVISLITGLGGAAVFYFGLRLCIKAILPSSSTPPTRATPAVAVPGIVRRPFSKRPRQRQLQREKD